MINIVKENAETSYSSTEVISTPSRREHDIQISTGGPESIPSAVQKYHLNFEIDWMRDRIRELENQVSLLEEMVGGHSKIKIISVSEITIEEAKKMIYEYCESHDTQLIYPSEIADDLGLDLEITVNAVDELLKEGKLEVVNG